MVLGILCIADRNGIAYCSFSTLGGFISLLVTGAFLAVFFFIMLCCIGCFKDAVEHI